MYTYMPRCGFNLHPLLLARLRILSYVISHSAFLIGPFLHVRQCLWTSTAGKEGLKILAEGDAKDLGKQEGMGPRHGNN